MMRPLGHFLTEFRTDGRTAAAPVFGTVPLLADLSLAPEPAFPVPDEADFALSAAFAADEFPALGLPAPEPVALLAPPSEPAPDLAAALAAQQAEHEAALTEARAQWAATEGATLTDGIAAALAGIEARLGDALATLLEPFLHKAARAKALGQLHETLATLLDGGETPAVAVSGPADLVAALRASYADRPGLSFTEADVPDVTVALGDTRIRSHLRAWTRRLDAALEASPEPALGAAA